MIVVIEPLKLGTAQWIKPIKEFLYAFNSGPLEKANLQSNNGGSITSLLTNTTMPLVAIQSAATEDAWHRGAAYTN
jgi:hypothetical protein